MSEQTTASGPVDPGQETAPSNGGCCAAIAELRVRAEQAAALRAQETEPGADGNTPSPAPSGVA
ncbi:hypothetical protein ACIBMX_10220 [Streptomyces phaeochromogenes]|uniref:Uncharacterized protein n=1 Tax=Streptomyces phaeochromogenes TaxID=1923 RepID=A0ABZ1H5I6_STRPH|nr:hypothetical protein [Streptomyces phaeochromogenes]MCX5604770.1 hypothetical protein [Streptomyces phaeochromogenes]WSD13829.1 hypothetical protein OHB35_11610 [Streptomyces phaeochromogenes]WSJ08710.1 hypothetical protein OG437_36350 [Streptomyces phaeochromogenes]